MSEVIYFNQRERRARRRAAERLRRARERHGWSVEDLAAVLEVEPGLVRQWESGSGPLPDLCQLADLCRAMNYPPEWFLSVMETRPCELSADEAGLLFRYRCLSAEDQRAVRRLAARLFIPWRGFDV